MQAVKQKTSKPRRTGRKLSLAGLFFVGAVLFLLSLTVTWGAQHFGSIGMDEIFFTLNMSLEGSDPAFFRSYIQTVLLPTLGALAAAILVYLVLTGRLRRREDRRLSYALEMGRRRFTLFPLRPGIKSLSVLWALLLVWTVLLVNRADRQFGFVQFFYNRVHQSHFIQEQYVDPKSVQLTFPEKKRNLIYILLESGESSLQDRDSGGLFDVNYIPELTAIAEENVSFSQSDRMEGAAVAPASGWTMAGMVAQFSGLPLKLYRYDDAGTDNSMAQYQQFLPGVTSLGDILAGEGYRNYFMIGSNKAFGGRDKFMEQHGNYEIWDYFTPIEKGLLPSDYYVWWGYEDMKLYEYAKEELTRISKEDGPFNFTMLTVDTHHIGGYVCPLCQNGHAEQYGNVWSCASRQLDEFLRWLKRQPFYENTTVVIAGDHCSMDPDFFRDFSYDKHTGETTRKVYNAIVNAPVDPVREKGRRFVTMDLFPTTLGALGVQIEGDRLGLGTNLFSRRDTLSEEFGYETLFDELNRRSLFYEQELLYPKADG